MYTEEGLVISSLSFLVQYPLTTSWSAVTLKVSEASALTPLIEVINTVTVSPSPSTAVTVPSTSYELAVPSVLKYIVSLTANPELSFNTIAFPEADTLPLEIAVLT